MGNFDDAFDNVSIGDSMALRGRRKKKGPVTIIPTALSIPDQKARKKEMEEAEQHEFMQECRERTVAMKDEAKCDLCKLRFRCYTEIKIRKKLKSRVRKPKPDEDAMEWIKESYVKDFGKRSTNLES